MLAQPRAYSPTPRLAKATPAASATVADAYGQSASLTQDVAGSSPVAPDIRGPPQDEPAEAIRKAPGTCVLERCLARTAVRRNSWPLPQHVGVGKSLQTHSGREG